MTNSKEPLSTPTLALAVARPYMLPRSQQLCSCFLCRVFLTQRPSCYARPAPGEGDSLLSELPETFLLVFQNYTPLLPLSPPLLWRRRKPRVSARGGGGAFSSPLNRGSVTASLKCYPWVAGSSAYIQRLQPFPVINQITRRNVPRWGSRR